MTGSAPGAAPPAGDGPDAWVGRLAAGGLRAEAAERVAGTFARAAACLRERDGGAPDFAFWVPGRIEVLGKHTDYAGGRSLLTAMEWGFAFVGRRAPEGDGLHVLDADGERAIRLPLRSPAAKPVRGWGLYPATVVRRVARDFPDAAGSVSVAFASDLPPASGMSSSSALVVGTFLALAAGLELGVDVGARERLAAYLAAVESGRPFSGVGPDPEHTRHDADRATPAGVGLDGGSEDHTAILAARPGRVTRYSFLPTLFEGAPPLAGDWTFAVASSGVRAEKAEGARDVYNRLSEETRAAARIWREETGGSEPHLGAILASSPDARSRMEQILARRGRDRLLARFHQFATECSELIPGAAAALEAGDLHAVGDHAARSQALADGVLGNQVPETRHLVASARALGVPAASAFGAGFGGAVWALVPAGEAARFLAAWRADYVGRFPEHDGGCAFLTTGAGPAAFRVI